MHHLLLILLHGLQLLLSLDAAYQSTLAIRALLQLQRAAKAAATISATARDQLHRTRSTEAAGAAAIALSLGSSAYKAFEPAPTYAALALNAALLAALMAARVHMLRFWQQQRAVPLVAGAYNQGLERSENVTDRLSWLEIAWLTSALVTAWALRPGPAGYWV